MVRAASKRHDMNDTVTALEQIARGAEEIVEFYARNPNFEPVNPKIDQLMDRLAERFAS